MSEFQNFGRVDKIRFDFIYFLRAQTELLLKTEESILFVAGVFITFTRTFTSKRFLIVFFKCLRDDKMKIVRYFRK